MCNIFLSYCWKDSSYANKIEQHYKNSNIKIHRDIRDIKHWESIRKFMDTIRDNDFAVLIITDNYLKSANCMYEVLQVMKEKDYQNKIFPVVVNHDIYKYEAKANYIRYWQEEFYKLNNELAGLEPVNAGSLIQELSRTQNIASSIGSFLEIVSDMNNPAVNDVLAAIDKILQEKGTLKNFQTLNIPIPNAIKNYTEQDKIEFVRKSYDAVIQDLKSFLDYLCSQDKSCSFYFDQRNGQETIIQIFKDGYTKTAFRIFADYLFGGSTFIIGIAENMSIGNRNSYNEIYTPQNINSQLMFKGINNTSEMTPQELAKEIWEDFIYRYL